MRMFNLTRTTYVTGISGTGIVAEGIQYSDGTIAMRWLDTGVTEENRARGVRPTTVVHESIESVIALHGHNGATTVVWARYPEPSAPRLLTIDMNNSEIYADGEPFPFYVSTDFDPDTAVRATGGTDHFGIVDLPIVADRIEVIR